MLSDLIEALTIFQKYENPKYPTHCEHDELIMCGDYHPDKMSADDVKRLDELGFFWSDSEDGYFKSFRFGSA